MRHTTHEVVQRLASLSQGTSPTLLQVGAVRNGVVDHDVVLVKEACPKVVKAVVQEFEFVSLEHDGLWISCSTTS